ncbi:hypothetical protein FOCG_17986 [Fusarium oxysporum f. sp. radicis-lycopersici 26381]|nr:hypothetical protein FOCG_17986 [Fusarium oxysporum f. sp. radicis-lycopersici 26381]
MHLLDRFRQKFTSRPSSPKSDIGTSRPTSSRPTPTQPEPDPPTVPPVPASIEDIRRQIWNEAYDKVKDDEPNTVDAYEMILSAQLAAGDAVPSADRDTTNVIGENAEARQAQMKTLVEKGRDKTEKEAKIKEKVKERIQPVNNVKDFVSMAVKSEPSAAVAWLGITTLMDLIANPLTEPGINRDGIKYVLERVEWYWELARLLLDPGKVDNSIVRLQSLLKRHVIKLYKKLLLYQMQSVCLYNKHWAEVIVRDLFKADDWQDKVDSIKKVEASLREDVKQHNSEELKSRLHNIDNTLGHIHLDVKAVELAVQYQTQMLRQIHHDKSDRKCLQALHIVDPEAQKGEIERIKGSLLKDSYRWILGHNDFQKFRDDPGSRLLWIKGDPGKGKTMLLCGIIDELKQEQEQVISYYFCQATQDKLRSAASVLRGLLWLLCAKNQQLISYVRSRYDIQRADLFEDSFALVSLEKVLLDMLRDSCLQHGIFVIDALDECFDNDRENLIGVIIRASQSLPAKWIVSSRNWPKIEEQFQAVEKITVPLELNNDSISQAVRILIQHKVEQLAQIKEYDEPTKEAVIKTLLRRANDTFLWVALVCEELSKVKTRHTIAVLDSVPGGLDELYQGMLKQVFTSRDADICRQILATACITSRPVSLDELRTLVTEVKGFSDKELKEVIGECGSFLTLQEGVIHFVHQSAQDFLLNNASDQILPSGTAHQHRTLFSRSLAALSETLRRNIYSLNTPGFSIDQVSPPNPDPLSSVRYSCVYWVSHLYDSNSTGDNKALQDGGDVHGFIQRKYLYWLECLSLLRSMSEGVNAVHKLETLVRNVGAQQLTKLLRDARRFILSHKRPIEIAPLQTYASALVFSPEHSLIRELFKKEEPDWMILKPRMEADWNACLQTLEGHDGPVFSVAFSADGQRLASGSNDRTVKVWDAVTGACVQTLEGHGGSVNSVAFSADDQHLASGSYDTIKVWDAVTGACGQTLEGHGGSVNSVAFSADGQHLVSGSYNTIKVWDAVKGACVQTLEGHGGLVNSVAFSADSQYLASGSDDGTVKVWDAAIGACMQTLEGHGGSVNSVAFSADGQYLASGSDDGTVKVWDAATGAVNSVAFSADGQYLASGSDRHGTVKVWDAATGTCVQTLEGHNGRVRSVAFSADGQHLASGSGDRTVKVWDAATGAYMQTLEGHSGRVMSVAFSADGQYLASGSNDRTVKVWDAATGACVQTLEVSQAIAHLSFDPTTSSRLSTNIGLLNLDIPALPPATESQSTEAVSRGASHSGYGVSMDNVWIAKDGKGMLWLPPEYRAADSTVVGSTVAIGCRSGRVLVMKFSSNGCR